MNAVFGIMLVAITVWCFGDITLRVVQFAFNMKKCKVYAEAEEYLREAREQEDGA